MGLFTNWPHPKDLKGLCPGDQPIDLGKWVPRKVTFSTQYWLDLLCQGILKAFLYATIKGIRVTIVRDGTTEALHEGSNQSHPTTI